MVVAGWAGEQMRINPGRPGAKGTSTKRTSSAALQQHESSQEPFGNSLQ